MPLHKNAAGTNEQKIATLNEEVEQVLEEARMVLPGLQALFGFQLIVVFNERFEHDLSGTAKMLHLAALVLTALAIGLIMAPAAYHRQAERDRVSRYFATYASRMITLAMAPLSLALSADVALVALLVTKNVAVSAAIGFALLGYLLGLWYVFPTLKRRSA